jgi:hypothetical protein
VSDHCTAPAAGSGSARARRRKAMCKAAVSGTKVITANSHMSLQARPLHPPSPSSLCTRRNCSTSSAYNASHAALPPPPPSSARHCASAVSARARCERACDSAQQQLRRQVSASGVAGKGSASRATHAQCTMLQHTITAHVPTAAAALRAAQSRDSCTTTAAPEPGRARS